MKNIYFVEFFGPCVGQEETTLVVGEDVDSVRDELWPEACGHYEQWLDDEDLQDEEWMSNVDFSVELYNPEVHDGQMQGGPPPATLIKLLKKECEV